MRRQVPTAARRPFFLRLLRTAAIAGVAAWLLLAHVVQVFRIEGASMNPVLRPGERVLVDKIGTRLGTIRRGQVVVFENPRNRETVLVKRVVGIPGDTVRFAGEEIRVAPQPVPAGAGRGEPAPCRTIPDRGETPEPAAPPDPGASRPPGEASVQVEDGTLFVLGDNRTASSDSRHFGLLPREAVIGRVVARIAPGSRIGVVR